MTTQHTTTGAANTTAAQPIKEYTRNYYEVQFSGIDESTKDKWFVSHRNARTLDQAKQQLIEAKEHERLCRGFIYTGPSPRRRIVHVVATCSVLLEVA